jgi:APA family basic amino acid/polyamine antiporter
MTRTLERSLTLRDIIFICVGAVIGSGIFIVPATVLRQTGNDPVLSMVIWAAAGVLSLLGALTYGEMGAMNPEAGGIYVYLRDAFGSLLAFLYGWTLFLVIGSGAVATLSVAFSGYLSELIPLSPVMAKVSAIAMIALVTVINVVGTRRSANVQTWTTAFKAGALLIMALALVIVGDPGRALVDGTPAPDTPSIVAGVGIAMIGVLWAYEGWQFVTFSAGETVDAQRNFPRGLAIGTAILIFLYCFANFGYIAALGADEASRSDSIAATAVSAGFGPTAGKFIAAAILVSIFSAANAIVLTTPRVFYAMARDRVFFRRLADVHPTFGTPALAIVSMSLWATLLAATGTFEQLLTYVVFTGWIFYALGAASIFVYRRRQPDAPRPFRVPGYPITPLLFVLAAAAIVLNAVFTQTGRAAIGIAGVLTGLPAYLIWRRRARTDSRQSSVNG